MFCECVFFLSLSLSTGGNRESILLKHCTPAPPHASPWLSNRQPRAGILARTPNPAARRRQARGRCLPAPLRGYTLTAFLEANAAAAACSALILGPALEMFVSAQRLLLLRCSLSLLLSLCSPLSLRFAPDFLSSLGVQLRTCCWQAWSLFAMWINNSIYSH